jgi:chemotaxis protein MotB
MARKKKHEEHENHERWLVSYADFITLLFAFFVVLYATSTQNQEKEKKFEDSIRAEFKLVGAGGANSQNGGMMGQIIDPIDAFQQRNIGNGELEDYVQRILQKNMTEEERKLAIGGLRHDSVGVRISLAAATFFPTGSSKLRLPALRSLDKVADLLKTSKNRLIVEGHTDDQPIAGGNIDSNWELASLRATSVVRYLIKYHGIDPKRLAAISYADQKPLVPNDSEEHRQKNRRIEILIVNTDESKDEPTR